MDDIERQLRGDSFAEDPGVEERCSPQRPSQVRLVMALTAPVDITLEGHYQRMDHAIDAIAAYCLVEEGAVVRRAQATPSLKQPNATPDRPADSHLRIAIRTIFVKDEKGRPRVCFLCVGKALSVTPDDPEMDNLIHEFYTSGDLTKHFKRKHLRHIGETDRPACEVCKMSFQRRSALQNHAQRVHGTVS